MNKDKIKIACLAPEIPALSATFVYNEILELEKKGFEIVPLSVHVPSVAASEAATAGLIAKTHYIYKQSVWKLLGANLSMLRQMPGRYLKTFIMAVSDVMRVGAATRIGSGLFYRFGVASYVAAILINENCRHLHVHFAHIPTDIAMYAAQIAGISFSFTSHANDLFERGWLLKEKVARSCFAVTISRFNVRFLSDRGAAAHKIHVIHCGVDSGAITPIATTSMRHLPVIGTLGRMVGKKGFDVLLSAAGILKKKGVAFDLVIAGDGPLRAELENLAESLELAENVSFSGPLPHHQVDGWLRKLDLFILPCRKDRHGDMDGIPVVLMEAMLAGVPVVSTRISGIPELVVDGETGCLADPDNPEILAARIEQLLSDGMFKRVLCENAIGKVRSEFDLSKNVEKLSNLFKEALS